MSTCRTIHVAAAPVGDVQDCARCGRVLLDHRGIVAEGEHRWMVDTYFRVGGGVAEERDGRNYSFSIYDTTCKATFVAGPERSFGEMRALTHDDTPCQPRSTEDADA